MRGRTGQLSANSPQKSAISHSGNGLGGHLRSGATERRGPCLLTIAVPVLVATGGLTAEGVPASRLPARRFPAQLDELLQVLRAHEQAPAGAVAADSR
ncbi:hypothetical protein [Blastococcus mobilis]|uniref:Uncharacterized protein n=1 Tax=Blastococcus mobilis TaxID=1938746 RepID=A0A238XMQ8_9ACTN|nr:hypothetical protein [Blastococcus mobilis]SNR59743.1 hypothetical protein SAMN06272737_114105 [Blastococcus mobilis]